MTRTNAAGLRRVVASEVVSNFGSMMSRLAIPWLAVLTLGATPWQMALLAVADVLAGALAALGLGMAIDRLPKRATMVAADLARTALLAGLAFGAAGGWLSFTVLLCVAAASGVFGMAFELARSAWIAQSAQPHELSGYNARLAAGSAISEALAFAITGAVFQWIGSVAALAVDAMSYLVSAALLHRVPEPARRGTAPAGAAPPSTTTLAGALRLLADHPALRALVALDVVVALAMGVAGTSYMIYVSRDLALPTAALGLVFALGGVGSAVGAALAPRAGRRFGGGRTLAWGLFAAAIASAFIPLAATAGALALGLLAAHQLMGDAGHVVYSIHDRTLRQSLVPADALARVDAAMRTLGQTATVGGALAGGAFATAYGARPALWLSTALLAVASAAGLAAFRRGAVPGTRSMA